MTPVEVAVILATHCWWLPACVAISYAISRAWEWLR